ncbi:FMN-linked oxidoreductase [Hymenopellis radicata]|nr:FMN-linked oxidoreductase [Hymenopellis radicata]
MGLYSSKPIPSSAAAEESALFRPITIGDMQLQHRIVHAPLTRYKASAAHVQLPLTEEYYRQRSGTPGTLLISEATFVAQRAGINPNCPGVYTPAQRRAWRKAHTVHANGCFMFCQIWGLGRSADYAASRAEDPAGWAYVSASPVRLSSKDETPRALTIPEIGEYVRLFADAARACVHDGRGEEGGEEGAGFDGVELHFANGYLVDQFLQDVCNARDDAYGGSIAARARFALEIVSAVAERIGARKVGVRISPWSPFQDMRMENPIPTFTYLVTQLRERHPDLAFLHVVEPRVSGSADADAALVAETDSNDFLRAIWAPRPFISAGRYTRASAMETADEKGDLIAFGRYFISNPDLPQRLMENVPLAPYDRAVFYLRGDESGRGYTDYKRHNEE